MDYRYESAPRFDVAGIGIRTNNAEAVGTIGGLWARFGEEGIAEQIEGIGDDVLAVYSDYESDHTGDYDFLIGKRVSHESELPMEMSRVRVPPARYAVITVTGEVPRALLDTWQRIWDSDLPRAFTADFEVYGPDDQVEIWLVLS
jgi:predicted transcriptional regulator YdeE